MEIGGPLVAGKYRLVRLVGEGGMGTVFQAENVTLGARCAIKFLHEQSVWNPEAVRRFNREAKATAAIGHPAIVRVFDAGRDDKGTPFIVMEYLDGESLGHRLKREGVLAPELAIHVIIQVLSGLEEAHRIGVVHRDVKPDNVFLVGPADRPSAKLLDFGVSRFSRVDAGMATMLTRTGAVLGTANYMAPEQARGDTNVDYRVDIFAVGCVLYEATTGALAFEGVNYNQVMAHILAGLFRRPSAVDHTYPAPLESVICKAMAHEREERYQSAAAMIQELADLLEDPAVVHGFMPKPRPRRKIAAAGSSIAAALSAILAVRRRRLATGMVLAIVAVLGLLTVLLWPRGQDAGAERLTPQPTQPHAEAAASTPGPDAGGVLRPVVGPAEVGLVETAAGAGKRVGAESAADVGTQAVSTADASAVEGGLAAGAKTTADGGEAEDVGGATDSGPDGQRPRRRDAGGRPGITHEVPF